MLIGRGVGESAFYVIRGDTAVVGQPVAGTLAYCHQLGKKKENLERRFSEKVRSSETGVFNWVLAGNF